ncbi:precorrin-6A synthase (deacetylating) [Dietzia aurantiaca]|nr:precorrin-6A synthase (deacetylating) [Dietzia aurantiaca]
MPTVTDGPIVAGPPQGRRRRIHVVGIGSGGLDQITVEAVRALQASDYAVAALKRPGDPLFTRRVELLGRHAPGLELVGVQDPERDRSSSSTSTHGDYRGVVLDWHQARALAWEQILAERPGDVAIPVWGDPAFYDSTLRILDRIAERGRVPIDVRVLPGISALQVLAARHRLVLHEIGATITVTTGRRLREVVAAGADNVVVMLNSDLPLDGLDEWHIWWGGNLGDTGETLVAGRVGDVLDELRAERDRLRAEHGWVMDVYLLRRGDGRETERDERTTT